MTRKKEIGKPTASFGFDLTSFYQLLVHLDVLSLRPQTNITSASARHCAARFGPSALKVRSFWMDYQLQVDAESYAAQCV